MERYIGVFRNSQMEKLRSVLISTSVPTQNSLLSWEETMQDSLIVCSAKLYRIGTPHLHSITSEPLDYNYDEDYYPAVGKYEEVMKRHLEIVKVNLPESYEESFGRIKLCRKEDWIPFPEGVTYGWFEAPVQ